MEPLKNVKQLISSYISSHRKEMLSLLEQMVNIDSGSYTTKGVAQIRDIIAELLSEIGFEINLLPSDIYTPHLLAVKSGTGSVKLMFLGHMDTVFDAGTAAKRPFHIDGDKAYGPGVCDMQGGLVCLIYAMKALHHAGFHNYGELKILLNSDEERGSETSEAYIIKECKKSDAVLVMEPGMPGDFVVIERQGGGIFTMDISGKASHAGASPQNGIHAIEEAARKVIALHELTDYDTGKTISVGVIDGGTRSNIIPDHVSLEIDIRSRTNKDAINLIAEMKAITANTYIPGTKSVLKQIMYRPPIEKTEGNIRLFETLKLAAHALKLPLHNTYCGGGSDGNYTSAEGIPTIDSLGPIGGLEHTDDEYLIVESLYTRTELAAVFVTELSKGF